MIDEEWASFFQQNPPRRINITLYGVNNETYEKLCHYKEGFDKTIKAIKLWKKHGIDVRLGSSVTNKNKEDLETFFEIRKELEIFAIADTYMVSATREREREFSYETRMSPEEAAQYRMIALKETIGEENFPEYLFRKIFEVEHIMPEDTPGTVTCYAGNCSFAVSWLGEMHPCVTMTIPVANVFEMGFKKAWKHIAEETKCIKTSLKCQKCNLRPICKNCAGNAFVETGAYDGTPDYLCRYAKENYRLMLLEAEKYKEVTENELDY